MSLTPTCGAPYPHAPPKYAFCDPLPPPQTAPAGLGSPALCSPSGHLDALTTSPVHASMHSAAPILTSKHTLSPPHWHMWHPLYTLHTLHCTLCSLYTLAMHALHPPHTAPTPHITPCPLHTPYTPVHTHCNHCRPFICTPPRPAPALCHPRITPRVCVGSHWRTNTGETGGTGGGGGGTIRMGIWGGLHTGRGLLEGRVGRPSSAPNQSPPRCWGPQGN